jgi:hypothetical protein
MYSIYVHINKLNHKMHSKPIRAINEDEVLEFDSVSKKAYGYRWEYI